MRTSLFAIVVMSCVACDHAHDHGAKKAEEPEEKTAQITIWTDRVELFVEHKMPVAGEKTKLVTHVTDLRTLEPRREGPVTFTLAGPGTAVPHTEKAPARAGIYLPELVFPAAGTWTVTLEIPLTDSVHKAALTPIEVYATKAEALKAEPAEPPEGISFLKEQQWKVLTKAEPATKRALTARSRVAGSVTLPPGRRASVVPPLAGRLAAAPARSFPTLGAKVESGQVLAMIVPPLTDIAAKVAETDAAVARTKIALEQAEAVRTRIRKLAAAEARSARDLEEAEFAAKAAQADHDSALAVKAAYEKSGAVFIRTPDGLAIELRAPIAGTISRIAAAPGEFVAAEAQVFSIVDASVVHVEARIPEREMARLTSPPHALVERPGTRGEFIELGKPVFVAPETDRSTRTVAVLYETTSNELRPGMTLSVHIVTAKEESVLALPATAIVDEDGRPVAYVLVAGETCQKRDLVLGIRDGEWVQVKDGIAEGERVVTKGAYAIRLASVSSTIPAHGHAH